MIKFITFASFFLLARGFLVPPPPGDVFPRAFPCPEDADFLPCVCDYDDITFEVNFNCSNAKSDEELTNAFTTAVFPFPNAINLVIDQTQCDDCALTTLNLESFGPTYFKYVYITGTSINEVTDNAFENSEETLITWSMAKNKISLFPFAVIGEYIVLEELNLDTNYFAELIGIMKSDSLLKLSLSNNPILVFEADLVADCKSLETILLSNGSLDAVPEYAEEPIGMFTGLQFIKEVDFAYNNIIELDNKIILAEAETLTRADFSNNMIATVHEEFVKGFSDSNGGYLDMSNNQLTTLDEAIWADIFLDVKNSKSINFKGNEIDCGCDIAWLVLNSTHMTVVTDDSTCAGGDQAINQLPDTPYLQC